MYGWCFSGLWANLNIEFRILHPYNDQNLNISS
jgi:hypothetical protein